MYSTTRPLMPVSAIQSITFDKVMLVSLVSLASAVKARIVLSERAGILRGQRKDCVDESRRPPRKIPEEEVHPDKGIQGKKLPNSGETTTTWVEPPQIVVGGKMLQQIGHCQNCVAESNLVQSAASACQRKMRTPGVEPGSQAWEACMMPLHYVR